jgi:hypothetical protein
VRVLCPRPHLAEVAVYDEQPTMKWRLVLAGRNAAGTVRA